MVVVDNARKMISKTIDIVVTSVLQTTAGKMIFGRYIDAGAANADGSRLPQNGQAQAPVPAERIAKSVVACCPAAIQGKSAQFTISNSQIVNFRALPSDKSTQARRVIHDAMISLRRDASGDRLADLDDRFAETLFGTPR